jgi:hypothetical protein
MKVAVMNFSGNVGKTTVAGHLLKPRMGNAPIFSIESINAGADADGLEVEKMKGKKLGIEKKKIRMVFNKLDVDESVTDEFAALFGLAESEKSFIVRPEAVIYLNEVFERLKSVGKSLGDITADETDYRAQLRQAKDDDEKELCIRMVALKRLAVTANKNLDDVFKILFN